MLNNGYLWAEFDSAVKSQRSKSVGLKEKRGAGKPSHRSLEDQPPSGSPLSTSLVCSSWSLSASLVDRTVFGSPWEWILANSRLCCRVSMDSCTCILCFFFFFTCRSNPHSIFPWPGELLILVNGRLLAQFPNASQATKTNLHPGTRYPGRRNIPR